MLTPAEERAKLYLPRGSSNSPGRTDSVLIQRIIDQHGLNDPYPVQYVRWLARLLQGDWGWSPTLRADVLEALLVRTPSTVELTLLSILLLIPPGRLSVSEQLLVHSEAFTAYTGLLTLDGLLNGRLDISISALRHMILPGVTLSLLHWATLGRVTRAAVIE